jgi:hypothetical protein
VDPDPALFGYALEQVLQRLASGGGSAAAGKH